MDYYRDRLRIVEEQLRIANDLVEFKNECLQRLNKKLDRLEQENEKLINQIEDNDLKLLEDVRHYSIKCKDLEKENKKLKEEKKVNRTKASLLTEIEILKKENEKLKDRLKDWDDRFIGGKEYGPNVIWWFNKRKTKWI